MNGMASWKNKKAVTGLKSVWVNRHESAWPDHLQDPDAIVKDVGELLSLLGVSQN